MYLVVVNDERGALVSETELRAELSIGRTSENGVVLPSSAVSRQHAVLYVDHGQVFINDLQSANGVYVNGERLQGPTQLTPTDSVRIGAYQLVIEQMVEIADRGGYQTAVVHPNQAHAKLLITSGPQAGKEFLLFEPITVVGRTQENDVTISDISISRRHASIERKDDGSYLITDQGSSNGTYLRGRRLRGAVRSWHGDKVRFGQIECLLVDPLGKEQGGQRRWLLYAGVAALVVLMFLLGQLARS
jgi:pSer/pThr/pTyr-binding forkhead associated (FHA) protein